MLAHASDIQTVQDIRTYVYENICEHNKLEPGVFQMTERLLTRSDKPCGIFFCLHGPRSVRLTAIWETDRNSLLFYDSVGERTLMTKLTQLPKSVIPQTTIRR